MAWIALQDTIWTHHKTNKLRTLLNIERPAAVGHLVSLWHFAMKHRPETGDLTDWGSIGIAEGGRWTGDADLFVKALQDSGLLDGNKIHNWETHALHYAITLERKERNLEQTRERVKQFRERKKGNKEKDVTHSNAPVTKCNAATLPYITLPNLTLHNKRSIGPSAFTIPTIEEVRAYCQERKNTVNPEQWRDHYESNGWMVGRTKMKSWQAAVRKWEHSNFGGNNAGTSRKPGLEAPVPGKYGSVGK